MADGGELTETRAIAWLRVCVRTGKPTWASEGKQMGARTCTDWDKKELGRKQRPCRKSNCGFLPCIFIRKEVTDPEGNFEWADMESRGGGPPPYGRKIDLVARNGGARS